MGLLGIYQHTKTQQNYTVRHGEIIELQQLFNTL